MLRSDKLGVTSVIRDLALKPDCYLSMLHFFRASSWSADFIRQCWFRTVLRFAPLYQEGSFHVLIGDGVKQSKEGRRIPEVKKLCQEFSDDSVYPLETVIQDTIRMGMDEICITDHVDYGIKEDWDCGHEIAYRDGEPFANVDYPRYMARIRKMQGLYGGQISVKTGWSSGPRIFREGERSRNIMSVIIKF